MTPAEKAMSIIDDCKCADAIRAVVSRDQTDSVSQLALRCMIRIGTMIQNIKQRLTSAKVILMVASDRESKPEERENSHAQEDL